MIDKLEFPRIEDLSKEEQEEMINGKYADIVSDGRALDKTVDVEAYGPFGKISTVETPKERIMVYDDFKKSRVIVIDSENEEIKDGDVFESQGDWRKALGKMYFNKLRQQRQEKREKLQDDWEEENERILDPKPDLDWNYKPGKN